MLEGAFGGLFRPPWGGTHVKSTGCCKDRRWATYQLFYKITDNRQIVAWVGTQATEAYLRVDPLLFTYPLQIVADRWSLRGLAGHQLIVADYRRLKKILHSPTYVQELRSVEERILSSTSGIGESSLKILQRQTTEYRREDYLLYSGRGHYQLSAPNRRG